MNTSREPVTIQKYALNRDALQAQEFLKQNGVESFIYMESSWTDAKDAPASNQQIRLVTRPVDADRAVKLLTSRASVVQPHVQQDRAKPEGGFSRKAGWMLIVFFVFYFVSSFRDGAIDALEIVPSGIFLAAALFFFVLAGLQGRNSEASHVI